MNSPLDLLNVRLPDQVRLRSDLYRLRPELLYPWWRPCTVSVLMVTDGGLDFGLADFGLSAFVNLMVNDGRSYVRFNITLAHLRSDVTDAQVMKGAAGIAASIKDFRFDNPDHFTDSKYDQVWLFGIETSFHSPPTITAIPIGRPIPPTGSATANFGSSTRTCNAAAASLRPAITVCSGKLSAAA